MDLPTCPACGQSVLDDDAQECPFCGSPMKGGSGGGRPAPRTPPKPVVKPPAGKPGAAKPADSGSSLPAINKPAAGKPAKAEKPAGDDDDPFADDRAREATAIPVSAKKGPGKTHEVKCPMCETPGFVSPKAAGQPVKCCNPECLVPIFNAPEVEKPPEPPPPPPPKKSSLPMYIGVTLVTLLLSVGIGVFLLKDDLWPKIDDRGPPPPPPPPPPGADNGKKKTDPLKMEGEQPVAPDVADLEAQKIRKRIEELLEGIKDAARQAPPTRKPACRMLAALAFAEFGSEKDVEDQLTQLRKLPSYQHHNDILPLVALGWNKLKSGDQKGFKAAIDAAFSHSEKLPTIGRDSVQAAIALAVALVADGKSDAARKLLEGHHTVDVENDNLAASLFIVQESGQFNLDVPLPGRSLDHWHFPLESATTVALVLHGRVDEARQFATQLVEPARTECLMTWGVAALHAVPADAAAQILNQAVQSAGELAPPGQARVLAALADARLAQGDKTGAADLVGKALAALTKVPALPAVSLTGYRPILEFKLPDALPAQQAALAAGQIAEVQAGLEQLDDAWKTTLRALEYLRGTAPSPSLIADRLSEIQDNKANVQAQLKTAYKLANNDKAGLRRKFDNFRAACLELQKVSAYRFALETKILAEVIERGVLEPAWEYVESRAAEADLNLREPFLTETGLPVLLGARFDAAGKAELRDKVLAAAENLVPVFEISLQSELDQKNLKGAIGLVDQQYGNAGSEELALQLACRLVIAGNHALALGLVNGFDDGLLRADGLRLLGGLAASRKQADEAETIANSMKPSAPEMAAFKTGLVEGLVRLLPPPAPPKPVEEPAEGKDKKKK